MPATKPPPKFLRPVARRRAFEEILFQLEEAIVAGHLAAGDRLPPERELATQFHVSRTSVREALRVLEGLGIVSVRRGAENGVTLLEEPGNALAQILRFHLALEHVSMEALVEFRVVIESWAARVAAERRTADDVARVDELLERMEAEAFDEPDFLELDLAFHVELARACGNELAGLVMEGCRSAIARTMLQVTLEAGDWPVIREQLRDQHRKIYEAIRVGDGDEASRLVAGHIRHFYDLYPQGNAG